MVFRRLISSILILCLIASCVPAALAEAAAEMPIPEEAFSEEIAMDELEDSDLEDSEDEAISEGKVEYTNLARGDRDGDDSTRVLVLQQALVNLGYLHDSADGIYGSNTEKAVAAFQRNNDLTETGSADAATQDKLFNGADLVHFSDTGDPESIAFRVEDKMNLWGFTSGVPTGAVNEKTEDCIVAFNRYLRSYMIKYPTPTPEAVVTPNPEESTGYGDAAIAIDIPIESDDDSEINDDLLAYVDGKYSFQVYQETLSNGDSGDEVLRLQRRLYQLKYLAIANGEFDSNTERALIYFQKKNGLPQNAVADETTQRLLYSEAAVESEEFINAYKIVIDVSDQRVYVYQWNGADYNTCVGDMICSTGLKATPTPLGTFQAAGPTGTGEWYWFGSYECYAKWATRIVGGILFHSVVYSKGKSLNRTSVKKLGRRASHGCIRLKVEHAKWIYDNCTPGTTVVVQE